MKCKRCKGLTTVDCGTCNAVGIEYGHQTCNDCKGEGVITCPTCFGKGKQSLMDWLKSK